MIAKVMARLVVIMSTGIMIVRVGPTRVRRMCETSSLVDQLRPKSNVKTCFTNTQSWYGMERSTPSWWRMLAICSGLEILPASTCAGSPPTQLNRKKMSRITPKIVGMICNNRRTTYAVTFCSSLHGRLLGGHVDVEVLVVGIQDGVLLVALHPRILQVVEAPDHAQPPRSIREHEPVHLAIELVPLGPVGHAQRFLVEPVVLREPEARLVGLVGVGAVEKLQEVLRVGVVGDPGRARHLEVAQALVGEEVGELLGLRLHADSHGGERLGPELGE